VREAMRKECWDFENQIAPQSRPQGGLNLFRVEKKGLEWTPGFWHFFRNPKKPKEDSGKKKKITN